MKQDSKGFTLLEVMLALMVFSVVMAGMAPAFAAQMKRNTLSQIRTEASSAAEMYIDSQRLLDPGAIPKTGNSGSINYTIGTRTYQVVASYCLTAAYCTGPYNRHLTVNVSYRNQNVFSTETVFTQLR